MLHSSSHSHTHTHTGGAVVLQFNVINTIPEQKLMNVRVQVETGGQELYSVRGIVPCPALAYGATAGVTYVILQVCRI